MMKLMAASLIVLSIALCVMVTPQSLVAMFGLVVASAIIMTTGLFFFIFTPQTHSD